MMKLSSGFAQAQTPATLPQRAGTLHVPVKYSKELTFLMQRVATDVNTLHDSSVHNKLVFAQKLAGSQYYSHENAPEREIIKGFIPFLNRLEARVIRRTRGATASVKLPTDQLQLAFVPKKNTPHTKELKHVAQALQQHVEGWVATHARELGIPHYINSKKK
jgi:hypothetical protein